VIVNVKFTKEEADELVRSHDKGWKQIEYNGEFKNKLIEIAKKCIKILKYDFGAVDIILGGNGRFYVLEVNSAPGLEERKLKIYADYFLHEESKVMKKEIKTEKPKENVKEEVYDQGEYAYYGNRTN
jgi:predicted ATP-grasp superfamily ATP-dependent carboligase